MELLASLFINEAPLRLIDGIILGETLYEMDMVWMKNEGPKDVLLMRNS